VPGFAVGVVEAGLAVGSAAEQEAGGSEEGLERNEVPGVFGDDVSGEEVDFAGEIGDGAASGAAVGVEVVHAVFDLGGALHLDAPERRRGIVRTPARAGATAEDGECGTDGLPVGGFGAPAVGGEVAGVDDGIVAFAVAEGPGDSEAEAGGFEGEGEFGEFSAALGVELALAGRVRARRGRSWASRPFGHGGK